jgi:tripartite-type tricarboxylate transporter receptor subunit TctC
MESCLKILAAACMTVILAASPATADEFLRRPPTIIVPYAAGSTGDTVARLISEAMEAGVGQRILVETRGGAGGNIGAAAVARAAPDGHTLLLGATSNFAINQFLYKDMGFDPLTDLVPVNLVADVPSFIFTSGTVPATTLGEFVAWAKANRGKVNYGSPGAGTTPHLTAELLNQAAGLGMQHVAYRGAGPAITATLAGEVQLYLVGLLGGKPHLASGKMRVLAVASKERQASMPDVPTTAEAGYPQVVGSNWWGLAAPKGTPPALIDRWDAEVRKALEKPTLRTRFEELGLVPLGIGPKPFAERVSGEAATWKDIVQKSGITLD